MECWIICLTQDKGNGLKFFKKKNALAGFGISLGYTIIYLSLIVLIPLLGIILKTSTLSFQEFLAVNLEPRVISAYRVTFSTAIIATLCSTIFGTLLCFTIVRYKFPGRNLIDTMIDLPFALPTAISGIALTTIYAPNGIIGKYFNDIGIKIAFTNIGIVIALVFVSFPFIVRTIEPVLKDLERDVEEAAFILGASSWQIFRQIILPGIMPALLTGVALAFVRSIGEYGSVIFIAANIPKSSEIVPLVIASKLENFNYSEAAAIAFVMLVISFVFLLIINLLQQKIAKNS
jgi:sulfate transport system permease protein